MQENYKNLFSFNMYLDKSFFTQTHYRKQRLQSLTYLLKNPFTLKKNET